MRIVVDDALADGRDVEDAVHQVGGPEKVGLGARHGVAQAAERVEVATRLERERADDGFLGRVGASPVAGPA